MLTKIKGFFNKLQNEKLTDEFNNEIRFRKQVNLICTLEMLKNYLVQDQLERTGLLYRKNDEYIELESQRLFWEWKQEGIINEFDDFEEATKSWISIYAL